MGGKRKEKSYEEQRNGFMESAAEKVEHKRPDPKRLAICQG
jgi:hypothetical protein